MIYLQIWAYESWDSLLPISMSPTANLWVHNTIFHAKSVIILHPGTRWNKNFAAQRQTYAQKMQDAQVKKSLTLCLLGNFRAFLLSVERKILSGISSECLTVWMQIRPHILSGLIWVQTVCKGYQQTTLVGKELSTIIRQVKQNILV